MIFIRKYDEIALIAEVYRYIHLLTFLFIELVMKFKIHVYTSIHVIDQGDLHVCSYIDK